jgi:hypothetical protein
MKVDISYRIIEASPGRLLRVRIRRADGQSALLWFRDLAEFQTAVQQVNLSGSGSSTLENDMATVLQMRELTYLSIDLEITPEDLVRLGATEWRAPQSFNIAFQQASDGRLRLKAREVDPPPGFRSLNVEIEIPKEEFAPTIAQIGMLPHEVRDLNLYGTQSLRRINEDEVELLFDSVRR